ncbi:hypothetical protein FQA39_LY00891 [Lamprigera yunnana]|nr:hypothetical protein FQA39_LY00891 [Lamprigera yunnana]
MPIDELKLIEAISCRIEIWDSNCVQFRNKSIKTKAWESVAEELGSTVEVCITTWKKLRDRYGRSKRRMPPSDGSRRPWDKTNSMSFLDKVFVARKNTTNTASDAHTDCEIDVPAEDAEVLSKHMVPRIVNVESLAAAESTIDMPSTSRSFSPISESSAELLSASNTVSQPNMQNVVARLSSNKSDYNEVTHSLITAINKLVDDKASNINDPLISSFITYHGEQVKELLKGKSSTIQREIRNRITMFMDEMFEEFE